MEEQFTDLEYHFNRAKLAMDDRAAKVLKVEQFDL